MRGHPAARSVVEEHGFDDPQVVKRADHRHHHAGESQRYVPGAERRADRLQRRPEASAIAF